MDRSSKMIGIGYIAYKEYMGYKEIQKKTKISKTVLKVLTREISELLE